MRDQEVCLVFRMPPRSFPHDSVMLKRKELFWRANFSAVVVELRHGATAAGPSGLSANVSPPSSWEAVFQALSTLTH